MPTCRSCGAEITWCRTEKLKRMPLEKSETGNIVIHGGLVHFPSADELEQMNPAARYVSHFATCPNASQHRKGR